MPAPVSPYRVFSEKSFVTDFTAYATKEAVAAKIDELKLKHGKLLARVVERKGGFVIYFEESSFMTIFGKLPPKPAGQAAPGSGTKANKPAVKSEKPGSTKAPIKLRGPFSSEKPTSKSPTSKPRLTEKGGTSKLPKKAGSILPPEKRGPAPPVFYGPPPPYLLARMSKDAQKYYLAKEAEFERLPPKQLDKLLEVFTAEMLKFDVKFEQERSLIGRIKEIQDLLNVQKRKNDDQVITQFLADKVKAPLENGKFVKVLQKYAEFNARTVADAIIKEIGRGRKECPLSDYALGQEIAKILQEKFPGKYRD